MRLAAPYPRKYERDQTYPEWPVKVSRFVKKLHLAFNTPRHIGRFKEYAFPQWWRIFWGGREEFLKTFGVHPNHRERDALGIESTCGDMRRDYDLLCAEHEAKFENGVFSANAGIPRPNASPNDKWEDVTVFNIGKDT